MRLINTTTLQLETFAHAGDVEYAVLSHTWGAEGEEVSFGEMTPANASSSPRSARFAKIDNACRLAAAAGLRYVWVDTCCIDKSSSAELTESINSMFQWYQRAKVCFAFLADWESAGSGSGSGSDSDNGSDSHGDDSGPPFDRCRWWTRCWTLQELLAPPHVEFYDKTWTLRGTKASLRDAVAWVSGIDAAVLSGQTPLSRVSVAMRMSWAAGRRATREEDEAYSLLGLFDVNMAMLYGEGRKAFARLQRKIIKAGADLSLFAWTAAAPDLRQEYAGLLAPSPRAFAAAQLCPNEFQMFSTSISVVGPYVKIKVTLVAFDDTWNWLLPVGHHDRPAAAVAADADADVGEEPAKQGSAEFNRSYAIALRLLDSGIYVRANPHRLFEFPLDRSRFMRQKYAVIPHLTPEGSDLCSQRALWMAGPLPLRHPSLGLASFDKELLTMPKDGSNLVYAMAGNRTTSRLLFKPDRREDCSSFAVVCRYRNPESSFLSPGYWECDLVVVEHLDDINLVNYATTINDYPVSIRPDGPEASTRVYKVPRHYWGAEARSVELTLRRQYHEETGATRFSLSISLLGAAGTAAAET